MDSHVINLVLCRQAGRSLLSRQVKLVSDMTQEGLLSSADASSFLGQATSDLARLNYNAAKEFRCVCVQLLDD
jgi:hypothetical protein